MPITGMALRGFGVVAVLALVAGCGSSEHADAASQTDRGAKGASGGGGASGSGGTGGVGEIAGSENIGGWGVDGGGGSDVDTGGDAEAMRDGGEDPGTDAGIPPDVMPGEPISKDEAPDGKWARVEFPDGYCRNGEKAHLMVRRNSASKKVAVYLEGGGGCFNDLSCTLMTSDSPSYLLGQGIFNFTHPDNPIRDWNIFYVPYCTGDVHAGDNDQVKLGPLTPPQRFSGYTNLKLYLSRIIATVPDATDGLLTGSSAGGFGAGLTADLFARNMPPTVERLTMLDDSGPPMPLAVIPSCLQDKWQSVWGFQNTVLKDCGAACTDSKNWTFDWVQFLLEKYTKGPNAQKFMAGVISSTNDAVISLFFGFGANDCDTSVPIPVSGAKYLAGLLELRYAAKAQTDRFGTFYIDSLAHTTLMLDKSTPATGGLYDTKVGDVKLTDWIRDLLDHKRAAHIGP